MAQFIASPLTVIINAFISKSTFPKAWKVARVTPIPKNSNNPISASDLRPISILPVLSKVYEKLIQHQVISYIDAYALYKNNISGFRKGHSATTVLLGIKDDIKHAMKRGEVTLMIMADYSKAFDTIKFRTVLSKLNDLGFSKDYLKWTVNYLTGRKHFVQVDDKKSNCCDVSFGVTQGSIMGPLIFNLYVADLPSCIPDASCHQYADDTTIYRHCKPADIPSVLSDMSESMHDVESWSKNANLVLNPSKTKALLLSTSQLAKVHQLENISMQISINDVTIEHVSSAKLLGTYLDRHLNWEENVKNTASSCYATLASLKRLKNFLPFHIKKNLAQSLVLSKLFYNDIVYHPLPEYLMKRLQKVQTATASFVLGRYASMEDILKLKWLPVKEHREWGLVKIAHKALYNTTWPDYLRLNVFTHNRCLRSSNSIQLERPLVSNTLQDLTSQLFNALSAELRSCTNFKTFAKDTHMLYLEKAVAFYL